MTSEARSEALQGLPRFTKVPEGEPIVAKTGNVVSGINYKEVADFIDNDFADFLLIAMYLIKHFLIMCLCHFVERSFEGDFLKAQIFGAFEELQH